jgi:hypothetical protein
MKRQRQRQRQAANRTFTKMTSIGLGEQPVIPYFSHSFLACLFMLRTMIFLTFNAAIFHEIAGTFFELYIINGCFATVGTHLICRQLFAVHDIIYNNYQ